MLILVKKRLKKVFKGLALLILVVLKGVNVFCSLG